MPRFYCHVENGGLFVELTQDGRGEGLQSLVAWWTHFGNQSPRVELPLLTVAQIDGMIELLRIARTRVSDGHSYQFGEPEFSDMVAVPSDPEPELSPPTIYERLRDE